MRQLALALCSLVLASCYSFTGASIPAHLETLELLSVSVDAQYGNPPLYQDMLTEELIDEIQSNSSFRLVEASGDATLEVVVSTIREKAAGSAEVETETDRSLEIVLRVVYTDAVKARQVWSKQFTQTTTFAVSGGQALRDETIRNLIEFAVEDIVLAVVSGW